MANHQELKEKFIISYIFELTLFLALLLASSVAADDTLIQVVENGRINWSTRTAAAMGIGPCEPADDERSTAASADVLEKARINAQKNLLDTISTIRINADLRIADRMALNPEFSVGLSTLVQNAAITHQQYFSDGSVKIELTMKLTGGFAQFVLPEEIRQVDSITATTGMTKSSATLQTKDDTNPFTGLIIEAMGIGAEPSLVPLVVDESGNTVYGPAFVSREFAVSQGMSGFAATMAAARSDKRVGERPMVVKAIRTHSTGNTDLVISNADAARLRSSVVYLNFLKACQVSIVLDLEEDS